MHCAIKCTNILRTAHDLKMTRVLKSQVRPDSTLKERALLGNNIESSVACSLSDGENP